MSVHERTAGGGAGNGPEAPFIRHALEENRRIAREASISSSVNRQQKYIGRFLLFVALPTLMGCFGLLLGYLTSKTPPVDGGETREIDFDVDFIFPFLLTLTLVVLIGFQTKGFASKDARPILVWPTVRRRKKIVHRVVVVDDEDEGDTERETDEGSHAGHDGSPEHEAESKLRRKKGSRKEE